MSPDSLPRLLARTMNFRLGRPRTVTVSPDGRRVLFLRSPTGTSRSHALWLYDVLAGTERLVADPATLLTDGDEQLTLEERARRERQRVSSSGVVAYSTDEQVTRAAFALSSRLFVVDLDGSAPRAVITPAAVIDPRLDPSGNRVAYAGDDRALHSVTLADGQDTIVVGPAPDDPPEVVWGLAEFIASEELDRDHGFWWSPDGSTLLVERYDESPVLVWHISDPAHPEHIPRSVRYPQAGTSNAVVSLDLVAADGSRVPVDWRSDAELDGRALEYLVHVEWSGLRPVLTLLSRDQRRMEYRELDPATGRTTLLRAVTDDAYVELLAGTPRRLADGRLLHSVDVDDARRLWRDDVPFTAPDVLVVDVAAIDGDSVIGRIVPQLGSIAVARLGFDGTVDLLSDPAGVATVTWSGGTAVIEQQLPTTSGVTITVAHGDLPLRQLGSVAEQPPMTPQARTVQLGDRGLPAHVFFPAGHIPGSARLPMLLDPYGGPHGQRVMNASRAHFTSQWFADQGFVVVVADGRGMPGRGPRWERLAKNDRAGTSDDQADAARAVAAMYPDDVDPSRVAVRGWSFGGYLAALCVLRHPDVFAAAVAGAPTTDERLYDTCYSERYLGDPTADAAIYDANSLIPLASGLQRPLMIIHGLADDNVFVAHSLQLSSALLAAGRPHEVLPLTGITHMAGDEVVAENILLLQLDFLRRALDLPR